jgi:hypothetical protein
MRARSPFRLARSDLAAATRISFSNRSRMYESSSELSGCGGPDPTRYGAAAALQPPPPLELARMVLMQLRLLRESAKPHCPAGPGQPTTEVIDATPYANSRKLC